MTEHSMEPTSDANLKAENAKLKAEIAEYKVTYKAKLIEERDALEDEVTRLTKENTTLKLQLAHREPEYEYGIDGGEPPASSAPVSPQHSDAFDPPPQPEVKIIAGGTFRGKDDPPQPDPGVIKSRRLVGELLDMTGLKIADPAVQKLIDDAKEHAGICPECGNVLLYDESAVVDEGARLAGFRGSPVLYCKKCAYERPATESDRPKSEENGTNNARFKHEVRTIHRMVRARKQPP